MLSIWTTNNQSKVFSALSPVLKNYSELPVSITGDFFVEDSTKIILALGSQALKRLQDEKLVAKNRTVTSLRNVPVMRGKIPVLISYGASIGDIDHRYYVDMLTDVGMAVRYHETGSFKPVLGIYRYVDSFDEIIQQVKFRYEQIGRPIDCFLDLETVGLNPYAVPQLKHPGAYIVSCALTCEKGISDVFYFNSPKHEQEMLHGKIGEQINWWMNAPEVKLKGANLKFDLHWLWVRRKLRCTNFIFDTTIVGSLLDENRSNALNVHTKIYVPLLGGYDDCVAPSVRLLTKELRWVPSSDIKIGDELVSFDEFSGGKKGERRRLRIGVVESVKKLVKIGLRLKLSNGIQIDCSYDHGFLVPTGKNGGATLWRRAHQLKIGGRLKMGAPVEECVDSFEAGWMSGFLDGEGYITRSGGGLCAGWSQKKGEIWDKAKTIVGKFGFSGYFGVEGKNDCLTCKITGWQAIKMLQMFRPQRLLSKDAYVGFSIPQEPEDVTVVSIERLGEIDVLSIQTSTHTFIAEGVCSHNSFNATYDKSRMDLVPKDKLLPYAGGDTDAGLQVAEAEKKEILLDPALTRFYVTILHPAARAFEKIEQGGVFVDINAFKELKSDLEKEQHSLIAKACKIMGGRIVAKHGDPSKFGGMNLTKASLLKDFMFSPMGLNLKPKMFTKKPDKDNNVKPSTAMDHLEMFADVPEAKEFVGLVSEYSSVVKTYNTYVVGFLEHLRSDGRFHPTYYLFVGDKDAGEGGTNTGRLSCVDPAFQTIPKFTKWAKRIRRCYIAPEGYLIEERDFSQGELRVVACVANETSMLEAYLKGRDLHALTGATFLELSYDQMMELKKTDKEKFGEARQAAKPANFGLLYGMGAEGFRVYSEDNYGVEMSKEEAEKRRNLFFEQYPKLLDYHDEYKKFARKYGYVRSPLGRIRHLPMISSPNREVAAKEERRSVNSPIQGCLSDMLLWTIALENQCGLAEKAPAFGAIHDAVYNYVPVDYVGVVKQHLEIQENLPFGQVGWNPQLDFPADAKLGKNMADMKEYER